MNRNKLYVIIATTCFAGYGWLFFNISEFFKEQSLFKVCLFKQITSIPCPSCGTTRGVISLSKGHFLEAIFTNPFSLLVAIIMIIAPIWIFFDVIRKKTTLFDFYQKTEKHILKPKIAIPLVIFVIINWIWNIAKGL